MNYVEYFFVLLKAIQASIIQTFLKDRNINKLFWQMLPLLLQGRQLVKEMKVI